MNLKKAVLMWITCSGFFACAFSQSGDFKVTGQVVGADSKPIGGATISFTSVPKRLSWDYSDAIGFFGGKTAGIKQLGLKGAAIKLDGQPISIELFSINGQCLATFKRFSTLSDLANLDVPMTKFRHGTLLVKITGSSSAVYRKLMPGSSFARTMIGEFCNSSSANGSLGKLSSAIDSVRIGKTGYAPVKVAINSYTADVGTVTLNKIDIESQANALFATLSQAEKDGQLTQIDVSANDAATAAANKVGSVFGGGDDGAGGGHGTAAQWAPYADAYQTASLTTAKKIPMLFGIDVVHGVGKCYGATIYPHNIGLGCTWDTAIVQKCYRVGAIESRGCGINLAFGPCIAVPRDKRWGRVYEGFAETPALTAAMGRAATLGYQTSDLSNPLAVAACIKHFAGDGGTQYGTGLQGSAYPLDRGNTLGDETTLRAIHLPGYTAVLQAGAASVMASFSAWNGVRMHENKALLTDWLKTTSGFDGFVNGDWDGHITLTTGSTAQAQTQSCLKAGLDVPMCSAAGEIAAVTGACDAMYAGGQGARIDDAVKRILRIKYRMGMFSQGNLANPLVTATVGSAEHRAVAREAVRKSLVLLKTSSALFPLARTAKITLVGPAAQDIGYQCGGWTMGWQGSPGNITSGTTIRQGFEAIGGTGNISYSLDGNGIPGDIAVVCVGEKPYAEWLGDSVSIPAIGATVIQNAKNSGKKVVVVMISGRPRDISTVINNCDAFICAWLPGTEGDGIAQVMYGTDAAGSAKYDFTGKLSMTMPNGASQANLNYGDANYNPLFKYGFGLNAAGQVLPQGLY